MRKIFWKMLGYLAVSGGILCGFLSCVILFAWVPIILEVGIQMDAMRSFLSELHSEMVLELGSWLTCMTLCVDGVFDLQRI